MNKNLKKGIILAGGSGTRLYPITKLGSKQLLPVYDKPMIYYPLSILMRLGISEILIISTSKDTPRFKELLGDGTQIGINIQYEIQQKPEGIAQAFVIGEKFIGGDNVALILGDNIFYGIYDYLRSVAKFKKGGMIFGYYVKDPERYGVIEFDENDGVKTIEEKPDNPKSNYVVTGLYIYDNKVIEIAKSLKPSARGELEITDINNAYVKLKELHLTKLGRGIAWLDTGTHESMLDAANFIATIEKRQGLKIACIEEIAYRKGYITKTQFEKLADQMDNNEYKKYLIKILNE
jgi:glucose-1-phosphate thymidylyltransferase